MTKGVAFNGSSRKDGNTAILLNLVLDELKKEGIETGLIQLAGETLSGCIACYKRETDNHNVNVSLPFGR
jgi:multimeric flavodoxin WrbA